MADWRSQGRDRVKEKSEGNTLKMLAGENCIRVLPDKKDFLPDGRLGPKGVIHPPIREFRIHSNVGPDSAMTGCGKNIAGVGSCWLCDVKIPELEASGNAQKRVVAGKIGYQEKLLVQASRFDPNTQKFQPPKAWWMGSGGGGSLAVRIYSKLTSSKKDYVDPDKGYNLNITRTGEGLKTRYPEIEGDESPSKVPLSVRLQIKDLDSLIPAYDEEDQKSRYFGRPRKDEATDSEPESEATEETEQSSETEAVEEAGEGTIVEDEETPFEEASDPEVPEEYAPDEEPPAEEEEQEPEPEPEPEPARPAPSRRASPPPPTRRAAPTATPPKRTAPAPATPARRR
jgi:hypothetical protein